MQYVRLGLSDLELKKLEYESNPRIESDIRTVGLASRLARVYYLRLLASTKDPSSESHIKYTPPSAHPEHQSPATSCQETMSGFDRRRVTEKTDMEVKATSEVMRSQPHCIGVLYGTHCTRAHLVPIPFIKSYAPPNGGNALPPQATIDNLFIECWMPRGMKQKWEDRLTVSTPRPQSPPGLVAADGEECQMEEAYTIYFASQSQKKDPFGPPLEQRNAAIANILYDEEGRGRKGRRISWYGPLLVVKHLDEDMAPIDIEEHELGAVWEVVKRSLREQLLSPN
ncbi:hypothetical protein EYR38_007395 [Pleurotus pulmonarius]|nr:hypothetical protein EYR38_007395 [Pleurotus pulmonarius]